MNKNLQTVFHYHETTKHAQQRYARSLGYMDWSTQPNPFREYQGAEKISLPLAFDNITPPYHLLDTDLPSAPLIKESLSQLLQYSMGIAAWKVSGDSSWAVRCNASSGNLHPTETYLVLPPVLAEQGDKTSIYHYSAKKHALESLADIETSFWDTLPAGSFVIGLSGISWREVWKYGERAFRYVNLDAGHAWQSINVSAKMLGWKLTRLDTIGDSDIETLFGLAQSQRFSERERGDMLFVVSPEEVSSSLKIDSLIENVPLVYNSIANKLSPSMQNWEIIPTIEEATATEPIVQESASRNIANVKATLESKAVILKRRSIHVMDPVRSLITKDEFHTVLAGVAGSLDSKENAAHLVLFVHRVEEYDGGLYILVRNPKDLKALQAQMFSVFAWEETEFENLYLLEKKDLKVASKTISCSQEIASDGAFSLGMLCNFSEQINKHGAHRYKELYWECGAVGQQLYLDATSMGLSGTGIGCFLDDIVHDMLGLKDNNFQTLYHFTIGRGYVDSRIQTQAAYEEER